MKLSKEVRDAVRRIAGKVDENGVSLSFLARRLGVSRQYAWQIIHGRTFLSPERALQIEALVDSIIERRAHIRSFGDRLRAARRSAGLTLKETANLIGYTWVAVQRWEKDVCLPKPGVLWHLASIYGLPDGWPMNEFTRRRGSAAGHMSMSGEWKKFPDSARIERKGSSPPVRARDRKPAFLVSGQRKRA